MRQLDLFGTNIDTRLQKKNSEEDISDSMMQEHDPVAANRETNYSLVGLAEEMLGETFKDANKFIEDEELKAGYAEHLEDEAVPSYGQENNKEDLAESIVIERLQISKVFLTENKNSVLEDANIAAEAKNSEVVAAKTREKIKKEPQKRGRKSLHEIESEVDLIEVPEDEVLFQKQYYPISEVAKWFRVNTSLLRFWENEFDVLKPKKNRKGDRLFRPEDVKNLHLIYQLLRQRKYTIEGAKEYIKTHGKKADIQLQLTNTLQKFRSFLLDLKANLESPYL